MQAGRLNERVTIQRKQALRDTDGSEIITWIDVATVWMSVEPISGREYLSARMEKAEITTRFRCRYRAGITTTHRLFWNGQAFNIDRVIDPGAAREQLEILGFADTVPT